MALRLIPISKKFLGRDPEPSDDYESVAYYFSVIFLMARFLERSQLSILIRNLPPSPLEVSEKR